MGHPKAAPPSYSILNFIVIFLGILLVLGFAVVVGTIVYRLANSDEPAAAEISPAVIEGAEAARLLEAISLSLPEGSEIIGHDLDGGRLAIRFRGAGRTEIWIVDLASGEVISRVTLENP
jgi:hypothetical protein